MDFILGILGILQMIFFPGLIVYRFFRIRANLLDKALIVFGMSLLVNYCAVFLLSGLGIYSRITLGVLVLAEILAILWLYRKELAAPAKDALASAQDGIHAMADLFFPSRQADSRSLLYYFIVLLLLLLSARAMLWAANVFIQNLGSVFSAWDAVVAWNRWATIWAAGEIPMRSSFYPQLVPANWSLSYVLLGSTTLQFFAKAIMPLFALMLLLGFFNLVLLTKTYYFLLSIVLLQPLLDKFLNTGISNGYVDIAVAFFTFAALYMLLKAGLAEEASERSQLYLLGALFAAGAAVTKQTGIYIALCYPILVYAQVSLSKQPLDKAQLRTWIAVFAGVSLLWVSWYALQALAGPGGDGLEAYAAISADKFDDLSLWERIAAALGRHTELIILFLLIAIAFPWMDRFYQVLTLLFAPFPLLWAWAAAYDTRNLAIFLPVLALVAGYAIDMLLARLAQLGERARILQTPVYVPVAFACLALLSLNWVATPQKLHERQVALQRQIFSPSKNQMLLDLVAENGPQTRVLTNYPMNYIPGLEEYQVRFDFQDYDSFLANIQNPEIEYLLVPNATDRRIRDYINAKVDAGEYQVISRDKQWKVFTLIRLPGSE